RQPRRIKSRIKFLSNTTLFSITNFKLQTDVTQKCGSAARCAERLGLSVKFLLFLSRLRRTLAGQPQKFRE
ncbi:MAG: hypothetical protein LH472_12800, partial [Pyrinomonadaceae bacterium]|nr:hypothetical protein [Pyrinomonadaceae bacterium]